MSNRGRHVWLTGGCVALVAGITVGAALPAAATGGGRVRGSVVSTVDGSPVRGAAAYAVLRHHSGSIDVRSAATASDGTFTFSDLEPGRYSVAADKRGWQGTLGAPARAAVSMSRETALAHPLTLTPVGYAQLAYRSRAGKPIEARYVSLAVDGCAPAAALGPGRICGVRGTNDRLPLRSWREYLLPPGTHRVRALVQSPLDGTVRIVTRTLAVHGGDAYTVATRTLRFRADPVTRATIIRWTGTTVTVRLPSYTDGTSPRLRTTLEIGGTRLPGTSVRYTHDRAGATLAHVSTVKHVTASGRVRAVVHGGRAYAGASSATITLAPLTTTGSPVRGRPPASE